MSWNAAPHTPPLIAPTSTTCWSRCARRGWAASLDELEIGLAAVAAPLRAANGTVVAAIAVSGPTARINDRGITALGDLLVAESRRLSANLGHQPVKEGTPA